MGRRFLPGRRRRCAPVLIALVGLAPGCGDAPEGASTFKMPPPEAKADPGQAAATKAAPANRTPRSR